MTDNINKLLIFKNEVAKLIMMTDPFYILGEKGKQHLQELESLSASISNKIVEIQKLPGGGSN